MLERILALAMGIAGADEKEQDLLETLCAAAEASWTARLRESVAVEDCGEAFCCAAAFTAAADFAVARRAGGAVSFTAGEISVKTGEGADQVSLASALRETAERLMAPYAEAGDFAFKGVRG